MRHSVLKRMHDSCWTILSTRVLKHFFVLDQNGNKDVWTQVRGRKDQGRRSKYWVRAQSSFELFPYVR